MRSAIRAEPIRNEAARTLLRPALSWVGKSFRNYSSSMLRVTSGRFRPEIDGLRFFAIIPVLFSHLFERIIRYQHQLGFIPNVDASYYGKFINHLPGVLLFFAISGYILTYQVSGVAKTGYDWSKYKKYIIRRFKRIAPPYYVILIATFFIVTVIGYRPSDARHFAENQAPLVPSLIASIFYCHWFIFQDWPKLFGAGWTLEIETQYYIMAPLLTLIYLGIRRKGIKIAVGVATMLLTSVIAAQFPVGNFWAGTIVKFFPYFFAGMLALELQEDLKNAVRTLPKLATDALAVVAVVFYISLHAPESGAGSEMLEYYFINIACVMAMFIAVSIEGNLLRRICVNRYVVIVGGACYSIYLTHTQVIFLLTDFAYRHVVFKETYLAMIVCAAIEVPIAILVGLAFYRMVERPFMSWSRTKSAGAIDWRRQAADPGAR